VAEQEITLQPGESKTVSFKVIPDKDKTYRVSVDEQSGTFKATYPEPFLKQDRGSYSELYVAGPSVAAPGQQFNIYVGILNWNFDNQKPFIDMTIYGEPVIYYDERSDEGNYKAITPVAPSYEMTEYGLWFTGPAWKFSITMPDEPLDIKVDAWIEQEYAGIAWNIDSTVRHKIPLI
jgi:hypothetical protein